MSTAHQQSSHGAFIFFARSFLGMDLALRFASLRSPIVAGTITSCRASNAKHAYNIYTSRAVDSRVVSINRPAFGKNTTSGLFYWQDSLGQHGPAVLWWFRLMVCYLWNPCEYPQKKKSTSLTTTETIGWRK